MTVPDGDKGLVTTLSSPTSSTRKFLIKRKNKSEPSKSSARVDKDAACKWEGGLDAGHMLATQGAFEQKGDDDDMEEKEKEEEDKEDDWVHRRASNWSRLQRLKR